MMSLRSARTAVVRRLLPFAIGASVLTSFAPQADPLPSWNNGSAKQRIIEFVNATTDAHNPAYIDSTQRIAVFDNDGTLWCEHPLYVQFVFMIDKLKAEAPKHPEWKDNPAFKALMSHDQKALMAQEKPLLQLLGVANSGMTVEEYNREIVEWLATARHPRFKRPYTDLVYKPMQELLAYFRANGFKTFVVSGGSVEFMRPWTASAYGIPPEQVVGSISDIKFEQQNGTPALVREPGIAFIDDGPGKPVGIYRSIGRHPVAAFGNSDGDKEMLEITAAGAKPKEQIPRVARDDKVREVKRLLLLVHHDDAVREYAYDRNTSVGKLDKAWDEAIKRDWIVVSMKNDWRRIFGFE
jgi:phosphoglycolate phosphatase-like HAD superfamily hydrolase